MERWGRFVSRTAWLWLLGWPIAALTVWLPAPRIQTLLQDDDTGFLPSDMPSQRAAARLREAFPDHAPASRAAVVFARDAGLTPANRAYIDGIARELAGRSEELDWRVHAVASAPYLTPILESPDGKAALITVDLPAELLTHSSVRRVREIKQVLAARPPEVGLEIHVTGSAALGELLDRHAKRDVDLTTLWAFVAVIVILLAIYRSPIAMLLPVFTIGVALMLSLGIVGWAASTWLPICGLVEMLIVVILVGSGVDYCLFLFARFREELAKHGEVEQAVQAAVARSGSAILAGAGTNAAGLTMLALANNRDLYTSGPTIAFALCIATLAVLTLTPSLLRLVGKRLFWPGRVASIGMEDSRAWAWVADVVTRRPVLSVSVTLAILVPPAVLGTKAPSLYDAYEEYPSQSSFVQGARLYHAHFFGASDVSEQTMLLSSDARLDTAAALPVLRRALDAIAEALEASFPVLYVRDLNDPLGQTRSGVGDETVGWLGKAALGFTDSLARQAYVGGTGTATRIDFGLRIEARSTEAFDLVPTVISTARSAVERSGLIGAIGGSPVRIELAGETPAYRDMRDLRTRDFRVVATSAVAVIFLILLPLVRSVVQSAILVAATLLTFLTAYGATWLIFRGVYGLEGLSWQVHFLLFIIILSLGQDYNIFVVTRIREELRTQPLDKAVATAVRKTGRVVSSCGLIMAATFASMSAGSLVVMKEFAVAFALGILIDTFVVRPTLVPALILLWHRAAPHLAGTKRSTAGRSGP